MKLREHQIKEIKATQGANRVWAFRNRILEKNGYYTAEELIDKAEATGFMIYDPFVRIRRGTQIGTGVIISESCAVEGKGVVLGPETVLSHAVLRGSNIVFGQRNKIHGDIDVSNLVFGEDNVIDGVRGENNGCVLIGRGNHIGHVRLDNRVGGTITIGDGNELHDRLSVNVPFEGGTIYIGHGNSLGRDGGGVISSSYRFGRGWGGAVAIGCRVESTRGAEILGFSALGWPLRLLETLGQPEEVIASLFAAGDLHQIEVWMTRLLSDGPTSLSKYMQDSERVSLFGIVKVKRSCLVGKVKIKDDTRVQCTYARDILIPERCSLNYSQVMPSAHILTLPSQDAVLECKTVRTAGDMEGLPGKSRVDEYPEEDNSYYQDWSWDQSEGRE
jgi:hypothetical protein